jgi:hypothetical protein
MKPKNESKTELNAKIFKFFNVFTPIFEIWANLLTRPSITLLLLFLSLTYIYQNGLDSVKFCHLSLAPLMIFGLSKKLILYVFHYQTPCTWPSSILKYLLYPIIMLIICYIIFMPCYHVDNHYT